MGFTMAFDIIMIGPTCSITSYNNATKHAAVKKLNKCNKTSAVFVFCNKTFALHFCHNLLYIR